MNGTLSVAGVPPAVAVDLGEIAGYCRCITVRMMPRSTSVVHAVVSALEYVASAAAILVTAVVVMGTVLLVGL